MFVPHLPSPLRQSVRATAALCPLSSEAVCFVLFCLFAEVASMLFLLSLFAASLHVCYLVAFMDIMLSYLFTYFAPHLLGVFLLFFALFLCICIFI